MQGSSKYFIPGGIGIMRRAPDGAPPGNIYIGTPDGHLVMTIDTLKKKQNMRRYIKLLLNREGVLENNDSRKLKISTYLLLMNDVAACMEYDKRMQLRENFALGRWVRGQDTNGISTYVVEVPGLMSMISLRVCSYCGYEGELLKCGKCLATYYCNRRCQQLAWSSHKHCCVAPTTKSNVLCMKMHQAWRACLHRHKPGILTWIDHIDQVYKQKSRAILLDAIEPSQDGFFQLHFISVSLRFFTAYTTRHRELKIMKEFVLCPLWTRAFLERNPTAYLLAIPFRGYFQFAFL